MYFSLRSCKSNKALVDRHENFHKVPKQPCFVVAI